MRKRIRLLLATPATLLFVLAFTWVLPSLAVATTHDFFAGKRMIILVGYPPGGGHDLEARVIARHLPNHIPGLSSVVVQNRPGAGGLIQGTYLYNQAKPDGLTAGVFGGTHLQSAILVPGVKYDLGKMSLIWAVGSARVGIIRDFLNARSARELTQVAPEKIVVPGRTKTGGSCVLGNLAMEVLGVKGHKVVCAYPGTALIKAAMERGEVSFFDALDAHLVGGGAFAEMYQKGMVVPVWQGGILGPGGKIVRSPTVREDVPTFYEAYVQVHGKAPSGLLWDALRILNTAHTNLARILVLPPGTPAERIGFLRKAIDSMAEDQAFVREWEKIFGQKLAPMRVAAKDGEELKDEFVRPAPWQDQLRKFLGL